MATTFLGLDLPVVSTTPGPTWATKVNQAFDVLDAHDHSSGKGTPVITSGLNINANLTFNSNKAFSLLSSQYINNTATLTGSSNALSVFVKSGDLYYTNTGGTAIQITAGGALVSSPGAVQSYELLAASSDFTISPAATTVYYTVDTSAARTLTLPLANAVAAGRIFFFKDTDGTANTNPITLLRQGSDLIDGGTSTVMNSNYGLVKVVGDGVSNWFVS